MFKTFCISVYGIAGQGVETAINTLAKAAVSSGLNSQSLFFPAYEKRSSFVWGQVKIDKLPIISKQMENCEFCLVLEPTIDLKNIMNSVKESGNIILNTSQKINTIPMKKHKIKAFVLDAMSIALAISPKKPLPNLAMLGAFAKVSGRLTLRSIKGSVENIVPGNSSIDEGFKNVKMVK